MGTLRNLCALITAGLLLVCSGQVTSTGISTEVPRLGNPGKNTLFAQSAAETLHDEFSSADISFLLLDAQTRVVLASWWDYPDKPIPLGSLVKPFIALSYADAHQFHYPTHFCRGQSSGCWLLRGHGEVDISSAIANSCNSYFRILTSNMTSETVTPVAKDFDLDEPRSNLTGDELSGIGNHWLISPLRMARAYVELVHRRDQPGMRELLAGMARSAREGTGSAVGRQLTRADALVKTGTAACTHQAHASGDGFVVALVPASQPALLLMVRVHAVPGAKAALTAGRMLRSLGE